LVIPRFLDCLMPAAKPRIKMRSNFKAAAAAGELAVRHAIEEATAAGDAKTKERIDLEADRRGYALSSTSVKNSVSGKEGVIWLDEWWWRYFEYGTVYIEAMPSLRPGHRHARKVLKEKLGADFEGFIKQRAAVSALRGFW
jgi:hypothetical protein